MIAVIKSTFKLMLRNKVFIFFLLIIPIATTAVLRIQADAKPIVDADSPAIIELPSYTERAVYYSREGDNMYAFSIKVYDASGSDLSEYVLDQLAKNGMFVVCRADVSGMTEEEVASQAEFDAFMDRAGCLLYLKSDFDGALLNGDIEAAMEMFVVSDDERMELFELELSDILGQIKAAQKVCGGDSDAVFKMLGEIAENMPQKKTVSVTAKKDMELTAMQVEQSDLVGYASSLCTIGFLFAGLYIANTIIDEKNSKVFTRMMLSKVGTAEYFCAKYAAMLLINALQAVVLAVCISVMIRADFGFTVAELMVILLPQGLIFSVLGMVLGVLIGDVMSSIYVTYAIWAVSSMLAGLWVPLNDATDAIKALSAVMPQKRFVDAANMLLTGDKSGYLVVLLTLAAYLLVIISLGCVGLKMQKQEQ